jgi:quinol monooxygenase YgiN
VTASKYSTEKEPGVYKYCICVPTDVSDEKTVWAIEECVTPSTRSHITIADGYRYADKKTLDDHMASPPVQEMIKFMTSNPIVEGTPKIRNLSWIDDMVFTKAEVRQQKDPFIVFAELEFEAGARDGTLKYWNNNLKSSKQEEGCFIYGFLKDPEQPDHIYTLEVYESEEFLMNVHIKSAAVKDTIEKTKDNRKNLVLSKLKMLDGFLARKS